MWSGPRNISTAMMRSFGARSDCAVSDEPFYGAFLQESGEAHPMAAETIADMDCDWDSVVATQSGPVPGGKAIWYQKHMPHHMIGPVTIAAFPNHRHAFLIRAPERVVASYAKKNELRRAEHLGFAQLRAYYDAIGGEAPIIDSDDILADPSAMLQKLCHALDIEWDSAMLAWTRGPHQEDGIWGSHWYDKVNASTGFGGAPGPLPELEGAYLATAEECRADYDYLKERSISA